MIIDCHGHYTTAPRQLDEYLSLQIANCGCNNNKLQLLPPSITDEELRESLEKNQLRIQRELGTDMTIFSSKAAGMGRHLGNEQTSREWATLCNDLIHRICNLYPKNFAAVCQLPQSPYVSSFTLPVSNS